MPCSAGPAWVATLPAAALTDSACSTCSPARKKAGAANKINAARIDLSNDTGRKVASGRHSPPHCASTFLAKARAKLPHRENFHKGFLLFNFGIALLNANVERF